MATVVIAPDSFKGSLEAEQVAEALAEGWRSVRGGDTIVLKPMADGGEGTLDALERAVPGAVRHRLLVRGPVDEQDDFEASWLLLPDGTAVVEQAACGGLPDIPQPAPFEAHSIGLGQVIAAALAAGARRMIVGLGGSAANDGGAGILRALGAQLLDDTGWPVADGNAGLAELALLDLDELPALPAEGVLIASDVRNPLLGPDGAIAVFGPQKGATPEQIPVLEQNLTRLAERLPIDADTPGAGAGGGAGAALLAWGATVQAGAVLVAEAIGLPEAAAEAEVLITGEGRYDGQTASGKAPAVVAQVAAQAGAALLVAAGQLAVQPQDAAAAVSLTELAGSAEAAMAEPARWLAQAGASLAREYSSR